MKNFLMFIIVAAFALPAFARTTYVTGYGRDTGYCNSGPLGDSCIRGVKDRSERDGLRDADWRCQSSQGRSQLFSGRCNSSCFPSYIPPRSGPTSVRCSSTCTMQCEI